MQILKCKYHTRKKNHPEQHHDHQKKKSFYRLCDSNMASWNIVFYIGFGTSTERAAKGKEEIERRFVA